MKKYCNIQIGFRTSALVLIFSFAAAQSNLHGTVDLKALQEQETRLAGRIAWPGFDPAAIPALIYDGVNSYLINHPAAPDNFKKYDKMAGIYFFPGRYELVRANSAVKIGGIHTACLDIDLSKSNDPVDMAAVLLHEKFHCCQLANPAAWGNNTNEFAVFEYPLENTQLLKLVYLELRALSNAYDSKSAGDMQKWLKLAINLRSEKYKAMPASCIGFERGIELMEGTAFYIQDKASGNDPRKNLPDKIYLPNSIRIRAYLTGSLLCNLLDRIDPDWKKKLNPNEGTYPDIIAQKALPEDMPPGNFDPGVEDKEKIRAAQAVNVYLAGKLELMDAFLKKPGYKIILDCGSRPLQPTGFDPMNMEKLSQSEVLHKRWVKLAGNQAEVEVLGMEALTEGAQGHPLFNGVKKITITGIADKPEIIRENQQIRIKNGNISLAVGQGTVETKDDTFLIHLK
jgi:hypothetical protein